MNVSSSGPFNKGNVFLGLIEYELNSLLGDSHLVYYISIYQFMFNSALKDIYQLYVFTSLKK